MESSSAVSLVCSWLEPGRHLFVLVHLFGVARSSLLHCVATFAASNARAGRLPLRPSTRQVGQRREILVRTMEAPALPRRRSSSHPYLCRIYFPCNSILLNSSGGCLCNLAAPGPPSEIVRVYTTQSPIMRRPSSSFACWWPSFAGLSFHLHAMPCQQDTANRIPPMRSSCSH